MPKSPSRALVVLFALLLVPTRVAGQTVPLVGSPIDLQGFRLVSETQGWVLTHHHLYWTENTGQDWLEITPSGLDTLTLDAVSFVDPDHGWLLASGMDESGQIIYRQARTRDGAASWQVTTLPLFAPGDPGALAGGAQLFFLTPQVGWMSIRQATSSNFRIGALFQTTDGGETWVRRSLPIGEPVFFASEQIGWVAGGPAGDELYRTEDGGQTWQRQTVDAMPPGEDGQPIYQLPVLPNGPEGLLPVLLAGGAGAGIAFYSTEDEGRSWMLAARVPMPGGITPGMPVPVAVLDSRRALVMQPPTGQVVHIARGRSGSTEVVAVGGVAGIVELQMVSPEVGWARSVQGTRMAVGNTGGRRPSASQTPARYTLDTQLVQTRDGGRTWTVVPLPMGGAPDRSPGRSISPPSTGSLAARPGTPSQPAPVTSSRTRTLQGQGFDKCEIATPNQLQNWIANSPYRTVNLYIGGGCRACANSALSGAYLSQLAELGWTFIPTWVGPQSLGYGGRCAQRINNDPLIAYQQGVDEAKAAVQRATELGLTHPNGSGTAIYYDLEGYINTASNRAAAKAFVAGWSGELQTTGNLAGVYGAGCASYPSDLATIDPVPDLLWAAHWITGAYTAEASVWDVACLSDTLWTNHQRIRQYTGGHNEAWGGVALNIDCDVIDGVVADLGDVTPPVTSASLSGILGEDGWYHSPVEVTLSAADDPGGSGVQVTRYRVDSGLWRDYSAPFRILGGGHHAVDFYSQDWAGNWEVERSLAIKIDPTLPPPARNYLPIVLLDTDR